jgi:glycosyltransferase involved in cell wall biosynthesis
MRILFLLTQDLESPSGMGRYFPLARELYRLGHQVSISALHSNYSRLERHDFVRDGVEISYVSQMHVLKANNDKIYFPTHKLLSIVARSSIALCKSALKIPADIIHIGKPHPMNSIAGIAAKRLKGRILFLDVDDHESASSHYSSRWQQSTLSFFEDFTPNQVDHITTHNDYLRQLILNLGIPPEKVTYLPTCVDPERLSLFDLNEVQRIKSDLDINDKKVVTFIGSLSSPSHPIDLLIQAFEIVNTNYPESVLLIVGGGEDYYPLMEKVKHTPLSKHVQFCGKIAPSQIANYYKLSDVVVDPVYNDAAAKGRLPLKLFESWITGVPFATGDVGDRARILGTPPAGILAAAGEAESLAHGILDIFLDEKAAQRLINRGYERSKRYTWDQQAANLESVYYKYLEKVSRN